MKKRVLFLTICAVLALGAAAAFWVWRAAGASESAGSLIILPAVLFADLPDQAIPSSISDTSLTRAKETDSTQGAPAEQDHQPDSARQLAEDWTALPACSADLLDAAGWEQFFANQHTREAQQELYLQRAYQVAPGLAEAEDENLSGLVAGQAAAKTTDGARQYAALLMNVASGRVNRATEIQLAAFPEIKTIGDLLDRLEQETKASRLTAQGSSPSLAKASQQILNGEGITRPVCARLFVTQAGNQLNDVEWDSHGLAAGMVETQPVDSSRKIIGEGAASPDGKWAAFRSGGQHTGGPVFLLDIQSGEWTNLIEAVRVATPGGASIPEDDSWWDVIGWFPDSRRLLIGPSDLPWIYIVNLSDYSYQPILLQTFGIGGSEVVDLAKDGSQVVYIAGEMPGGQVLTAINLTSGKTTPLIKISYEEGVLQFPRFSPDGKQISYVVQSGDPQNGLRYSIQLYDSQARASRDLVQGDLGPTRPVWSPDGQYLAFTRSEDQPGITAPQSPEAENSSIWVLSLKDGQAKQVTAFEGPEHAPVWANDSQTLAFTTQEGQVGLVNIEQPGVVWKASDSAGVLPLFTRSFFIP